MRWLAYRVSRKGKPDIFYVPYEPLWFFEAAGRSYLRETRKNEKFEIVLLTPRIENVDADFLKKQIQGGILDGIYRDEKFVNELLRRIISWSVGRLRYFWITFVLPVLWVIYAIFFGYTSGLTFDLLLASYLFKGRKFFIKKVREEVADYHKKIKRGIEWSFKDLADVKQIEHRGLRKLAEIVEKEGYIKAMHACAEVGLPELTEFYTTASPIDEQTIQEPHLGFALKSKLKELPKREFTRRALQRKKLIKDSKIDLFNYKVNAKWLQQIKTFPDLDVELEKTAKEIGATEITLFTTPKGYKIKAYEIGNPRAEEKILIKAGMHGREPAGPLAVLQIMKSFEKEGRHTKTVLRNSQIIFIPCDDPEGFSMRAWMAVDMEGHEEHWPPQRRIVRYRDTNGVWGDRVQSLRIIAIQDYIRNEIKRPTLAFDLHETVGKFADLTFRGAGILSIEDFHIPEKTRQRLESMYIRPKNKLSRALCKIPLIGREYAYSALKEIPAFEIGEAAMQRVREKGLKTYRGEYQKLLEQPHPFYPPQILAFDDGRTVDGPLLTELEIRVCTAWLYNEFGTLAITTETFQNSMDERVLEQVAFVEGAILKKLGFR